MNETGIARLLNGLGGHTGPDTDETLGDVLISVADKTPDEHGVHDIRSADVQVHRDNNHKTMTTERYLEHTEGLLLFVYGAREEFAFVCARPHNKQLNEVCSDSKNKNYHRGAVY